MLFMSLYILSIIFSLSSTSWMMIWMGMEINLLMFIFIMMNKSISLMKTESSMKYFLIQSMGSLIFLLSITTNLIYYNEKSIINAMVPPIALMMKSGMAPMHLWTPLIVTKFSFKNLFLFLTLQKLVPIFVIFHCWFWIMPYIALINVVVGSFTGIMQSSLIKLLLFSSINNMGWMIMSMMESMSLFIIFFINYMILSYLMMHFMFMLQIKWISQIKSNKFFMKWFYFSIIMSMSGFPPFIGFTPKWMVLKYLYMNYSLIINLSIFLSVYVLYFYIKSSLKFITVSFYKKKWEVNNKIKWNIFIFTNIMGPFLFYLI